MDKRKAVPPSARHEELKRILQDRQRELAAIVQGKIRGVRADGSEKSSQNNSRDTTPDVDIQDEIELVLIQMKANTLKRINEALARLDEDRYGLCFECGDEISESRLRSLPFAIRCKDCEEAHEFAAQRERTLAQRRSRLPL